jgi:hypothetical protein
MEQGFGHGKVLSRTTSRYGLYGSWLRVLLVIMLEQRVAEVVGAGRGPDSLPERSPVLAVGSGRSWPAAAWRGRSGPDRGNSPSRREGSAARRQRGGTVLGTSSTGQGRTSLIARRPGVTPRIAREDVGLLSSGVARPAPLKPNGLVRNEIANAPMRWLDARGLPLHAGAPLMEHESASAKTYPCNGPPGEYNRTVAVEYRAPESVLRGKCRPFEVSEVL